MAEKKTSKPVTKKKEPKIKIDHKAKTITMIEKVYENLTQEEQDRIFKYKPLGYEITIKDNPKRESLTADAIKAAIKEEADLKTFEKIKEEKGFFAARGWYLSEYKKNK